GEPALSFVHRHATRDLTSNLDPAAGRAAVAALLDEHAERSFAHATLHAGGTDLQLRFSKKGKQALVKTPRAVETLAEPATPAHDRAKARALPLDLPFWVELGLTDERHRLVPSMARKWKQIDKFLEVLEHALDDAAMTREGPAPRVVDFGSGKGYLTFAVHEYLRRRFGGAPEVTGVELRADLVALGNAAVARAHCNGLCFVQGDLRSFAPEAVDVMIALHACDTATDHALDLGLRAGARILIASPCCHKELRPQLTSPKPLAPLLRHGIHLGQEAEMLTDGLRALALEASGYDAKVFEFVSLEHTRKNKMILATRRLGDAGDTARRAAAEADSLKAFYGIREQCLERLLRERGAGPAGVPAASG
ncbi:MAG: SAM-dependent methyltransferase, partial [Caldimonas sp.]